MSKARKIKTKFVTIKVGVGSIIITPEEIKSLEKRGGADLLAELINFKRK